MSQPSVTINEINGALGVLATGEKILAMLGPTSSGTANVPGTYARTKDIVSTFGAGPGVEAACFYVETFGKPILFCKTGASVAGVEGTLTSVATGTSVVTLDTTDPNDDYELVWKAITGGTIGTAGITYQYSLDGERTWSATLALGTANTFAWPGAGGVNLDFGAGTVVAGDKHSTRTTAPNWNSTELTDALTALGNSAVQWGLVAIVGPIDATAFDAIEVKMSALSTAGTPRAWIGNTRMPNAAESEATYLAAMNTIFSAKATNFGELCSGAAKITSAVTGRKYKRPISFFVGAREGSVSEEVNIADPNLGPATGVSIRDANGNVDEHDESINPGLDDGRFTVLRTIPGLSGVYVNRPRLFSSAGSDFYIMPHRRVMNLAREALRLYLTLRLNKPIRVNKTTGYILESEALEIEAGADAILRAVLEAKPKASGGGYPGGRYVSISRTDNLLSTKTMTGQARIVPLAYPETIILDMGFSNPALFVQAA